MPPERRALFCTFWFRFQDGFRVLTNQDLLLNSSALCSGFRRTMNLPMQSMPRWTTFFPYGQMGTRQGGKRATWERACVKDRRSPGNYRTIVSVVAWIYLYSTRDQKWRVLCWHWKYIIEQRWTKVFQDFWDRLNFCRNGGLVGDQLNSGWWIVAYPESIVLSGEIEKSILSCKVLCQHGSQLTFAVQVT